MAKAQQIPDPLKRRHLLEERLDPARALKVAEAYLSADRLAEAVAFLEQAEAEDRLQELREQALATGDLFLARSTSTALGVEVSSEEWLRLAEAAEAAGKERYASEASRHAKRG